MKIYFEKKLPVLLFTLVVSTSTLASLPQVESALIGMKKVYNKQDFGLRILREAMLVGLASQYGAQERFILDGRITEGGKPVWKKPESSLSACCKIQEKDRRKGTT